MRYSWMVAGTMLGALGCGDGATAPAPDGDGRRLAAQFERLADSVESGGYSPTADALRHAAEIVRLTGHATPVALTLDGETRSFLAVAEQLDFPNIECTWPSDTVFIPPPDSGGGGVVPPDGSLPPDTVVAPPRPGEPPDPPECILIGTYSMRTLIAWEPEDMAEVVRIVADLGSNQAATGVPDVMTELPVGKIAIDSTDPDSTGGGGGGGGSGGGYPGFMGEYLVRDVGSWWAVEGSQANVMEDISGDCTADRATFDWAEFGCEAARFRFEFDMRVEALRYEETGVEAPPELEGSHTLALESSSIDGVRLTVIAWLPPPLPPEPGPGPDPIPGDSLRQDSDASQGLSP